jgi:cupin fold WbuC family metalloprotein
MKGPRIVDRGLLDSVTECARNSPRKRKNFNFHPSEAAIAHRLLNAVEPGSYIPPHRHLDPNKDESIVIVRGRLGALFFDDAGTVMQTHVLEPEGERVGVDVPYGTWHTFVALQPGTVFFEAKAGPYVPMTSAERAPWAPAEGDAHAPAYLAELHRHFG